MDGPLGFELAEEKSSESLQRRDLNFSPNNILSPKNLCPFSASACQLLNCESRGSSLNVPALESSLSPPSLLQSSLVLDVPPVSQLPSVSPSSRPSLANLPSTRPSIDFLSSGQTGPRTETPKTFFTAALGIYEDKRLERLVNVVQGFSNADGFSDGLYTRLSGWSRIFRSKPEVGFQDGSAPETTYEAEVAHRLRRLEQTRHQIKRKDWGDTRIWLIFLAHEVEYISQSEDIDNYTSRGVDRMSAAINMVKKHLDTASSDYKRARNIVQVMKEGGPASLLERGGVSQSKWEKFLTLDDITHIFAYRRIQLPDLDGRARSHDSEVSHAIIDSFIQYGWSIPRLLDANTKVMKILKPYLRQHKRQHTDSGPGDSEPKSKRLRADPLGASTSSSLDQLSPCYNVGSTPGSKSIHLIPFDANNMTMDLVDTATASHLSHTINDTDKFIDPATSDNLFYSVNEFADPITTSNLNYTVSISNEIPDLGTSQSMNTPSTSDHGMKQLIDPSVVKFLQWTVNELTDPSTARLFHGATP